MRVTPTVVHGDGAAVDSKDFWIGKMQQRIDFLAEYQSKTKRNYLERVTKGDKAECGKTAKRFGYDYWDGDRRYGYGGMTYDGRWRPVAEKIAAHYQLAADDRVLDVGCGKGFLLYELTQVVPGLDVRGLDISSYAVANCKEELRDYVTIFDCTAPLPFARKSFDLALSINVLHNIPLRHLTTPLWEIEEVAREAWICVESFRTEEEKDNLLNWQLTCESFFRPEDWEYLFRQCGYNGDYGFIFFEDVEE